MLVIDAAALAAAVTVSQAMIHTSGMVLSDARYSTLSSICTTFSFTLSRFLSDFFSLSALQQILYIVLYKMRRNSADENFITIRSQSRRRRVTEVSKAQHSAVGRVAG